MVPLFGRTPCNSVTCRLFLSLSFYVPCVCLVLIPSHLITFSSFSTPYSSFSNAQCGIFFFFGISFLRLCIIFLFGLARRFVCLGNSSLSTSVITRKGPKALLLSVSFGHSKKPLEDVSDHPSIHFHSSIRLTSIPLLQDEKANNPQGSYKGLLNPLISPAIVFLLLFCFVFFCFSIRFASRRVTRTPAVLLHLLG